MADIEFNDSAPVKIDDLNFPSKDGNNSAIVTIEAPDTKDL